MLISLNWIKEFVTLPAQQDDELINLLTTRTAEVDSVVRWGAGLSSLLCAEVKELQPGPRNTNIAVIDCGKGQSETVVCAAKNIRIGMKTIYAPPGSLLPNGVTVGKKEFEGIVSNGFLCSETEAGLGQDSSGIADLPDSCTVGKRISEIFPDSVDVVVEIDNKSLTHRPDLWSHAGFAREFSTICSAALTIPYDAAWRKNVLSKSSGASPVTIVSTLPKSCTGYCGISIDGVKNRRSSPEMRFRLHRVGLRAVSELVDVGNYVMLELGIPLHVYDRASVQGTKISITELTKDSELELLDGSTAKIAAGDTVIRDDAGPLVLAGIMGGKRSATSDETEKLFIEVANWRPSAVHKTSLRTGVRTDSSLRYEKSLDSQLLERTAVRAAELFMVGNPGATIHGELLSVGIASPESATKSIGISFHKIAKVLGIEVPKAEILRIFAGLGFGVTQHGDDLTVEIPSFRATKDISRDADLIEEIGRIWGYEKITPAAPTGAIVPVVVPPLKQLQRSIREFMTMFGRSLEVMTYPLVGSELLSKSLWSELNDGLTLKNPWSEDSDRMRPSLVPNALQIAANNAKQFQSFRFFELGRAYVSGDAFCTEREDLLFALFNKEQSEYTSAIEIAEHLLQKMHHYDVRIAPYNGDPIPMLCSNWKGYSASRAHTLTGSNSETLGVVFQASDAVMQSFKIRGNLVIGVIPIAPLVAAFDFDPRRFAAINTFPSSSFDITVTADAKAEVLSVLNPIRESNIPFVEKVGILSVFPLEDEKKAVTVRTTVRKNDGTLTKEEIDTVEKRVLSDLASAGYSLRG